jgi:uncharacterized membrane protein
MLALAIAGMAIAAYLSIVRALGEAPVCDPSHGCDVVAQSKYAVLFGIPVAYLGLAFTITLVVATAAWWWTADRRALQASYVLLLFGTLFVAYLTFLELFVIHAVCIWCATFAVTIVAGLVSAAVAMRRSGAGATAPSRTR